ncbi:MAG TPA: DUF2784 domain-containing protein [Micromonosporaceae bacterium]|nr:DUF2784 domain-containing protein [Micromonosporaceae bacterium]
MGYRLLATLVLALHFAYLAYLVVGGFLAWRWPRTIWAHAAAVGWGATIVLADVFAGGITCPLTYAEDWARRRAGDAPATTGFIDRYLEGVVYPERYAAWAQAFVAAAVLLSWVGYARRVRRRAARSDLRRAALSGTDPR